MKIRRAVKCAAIKEQLKEALRIAKKTNIYGLEIQEILPLMKECSFEKRAKMVIDSFKKHSLTSLVYHFPLISSLSDISEAQKFDLASESGSHVLDLTEETIKEAALVGKTLDIKTEIPIVVHLLGFVKANEVNLGQRNEKLKLGEERLIKLKEIADFYSKESGLKLIIVRENNPPDQVKNAGTLDFHPKDIVRTAKDGIWTNLDFAHIWLTILYYKNGKGELPGVELTKKIYPTITLEETINLLKSSLKLLHLNDAGPDYTKPFEGVEIGKGNLPHSQIIPLICNNLKEDIIGTYEMKYGHEDPDSIFRSDQFYRKLFKEKFKEYFL